MFNNDSSNKCHLNDNIELFFKESKESVIKCSNLLSKFDKEIISTLELFHNNLSTIYDENNEAFDSMLNDLLIAQNNLEYVRMTYYKSMHDSLQQGNLIEEGTDKMKSIDPSEYKIILQSKAFNDEQMYIYQLERCNAIIKECNQRYENIMTNLRQIEESRIVFLKNSQAKFIKMIDEVCLILKEMITKIKEICPKDSNEIKKQISYLTDNILIQNEDLSRIPNAKYISYKEYGNKSIIDESILTIDNPLPQSKLTEEHHAIIIDKCITNLLDEDEMPIELIAQLIEVLKSNIDLSKKFLDAVLKKKSTVSVAFENYNNLLHLSNILCFISLNHGSISSDKFELNFTIIFISERIFYFNSKTLDKVYLSALLSTNLLYKTNSFWKDIIEYKLAKKLDDHIIPLKNLKIPEEENNFFSKLGDKIGNKLGLNNNIKKNSLLYKSRIHKYILHYDELPIQRLSALDSIATPELISIIKETIPNLATFNFPHDKAIALIGELEKEYQIPTKETEYFLACYQVSSHTIKKRLLNTISFNEDKFNSYRLLKPFERNIKLIKLSFAYLNQTDYLSCMLLSKSSYKSISKKIFKIVLKKPNLPNKIRLKIWSNILNIRSLRQQYDYKKLSTDLSNVDETTKTEIKMDIPRTFIGSGIDEENTRIQLTHVLQAISQVNEGVKYCQGMNYLAQFILEITQDEELSFFIFLGFFKTTEYSLIFARDLLKIRIFFYVFKRLLSLFQPELYSYFTTINFDVHYFLAPWFITLFQNIRPSLPANETPIILVKVLDEFIISGWTSLMKIILNILGYFESQLLKMKYDDLLQFLVNNTFTLDLFANQNLAMYDKMIKETIIPKNLIAFIEKEFNHDEKAKENEKTKMK